MKSSFEELIQKIKDKKGKKRYRLKKNIIKALGIIRKANNEKIRMLDVFFALSLFFPWQLEAESLSAHILWFHLVKRRR
jgi:hypothetical protein